MKCHNQMLMRNENLNYLWTDAWLLLSIIVADRGNGADLEGIIGAGDAINHAIFTAEEIQGGLHKLVRGGFVDEVRGRFKASNKTKEEYEKRICRKRYLLVQLHLLDKFIGVIQADKRDKLPRSDNKFKYPGLTKDRIHIAYEAYRKKMEILCRKS